ncbi:MAG: c-type cytochrome domain-containing protein [Pseudomonadota bacterium]
MKSRAIKLWSAVGLVSLSACNTTKVVSYQRDVYPVLEANCLECHTPPTGEGYRAVGLNMESYASLMRGTIYGSVVMPGDSQCSILTMLVEGRADMSMRMPHQSEEPLQPEEIEILRHWVNQGANNN